MATSCCAALGAGVAVAGGTSDSPQLAMAIAAKPAIMRSVYRFISRPLDGWGGRQTGRDVATGNGLVEVDQRYFRPAEVAELLRAPSKAARVLGWKAKVGLDELVDIMMESDMKVVKDEAGVVD